MMVSIEVEVNNGNLVGTCVGKFSVSDEFIIFCCRKDFNTIIVRINDVATEDNQAEICDLNGD